MDRNYFYNNLKKDFPHSPTPKQEIALQLLTDFVQNSSDDEIFLLKGFAGTGKTTIIGALVKNLWKIKISSILLAPTGRAAKVMSNYSTQVKN